MIKTLSNTTPHIGGTTKSLRCRQTILHLLAPPATFWTLLLVIGFSLRYNFRMRMCAESKLKYTYQAFQEGIMGRNPSLFRSLIRSAKFDMCTHPRLQLLWRIPSQIKSFWRWKSKRNLKDEIGLLIWWEN
jgi:hypothetical protein